MWYAQAYNGGWLHSLTLPEGGYLNTLQRLVAGVSLWFPLRLAPLVMVLAGLFFQLAPVAILLSGRCRNWASLPVRILFAASYIALPNSGEIHIVLTNAQWHLALAEVLLAFAAVPKSWKGQLLDASVFLVGGFTGPFTIPLFGLVLLYGWLQHNRWSYWLAGFMSIGITAQIYFLMQGHRVTEKLGATFPLFLRLFGGDLVQCALFGKHGFLLICPQPVFWLSSLLGISVYLYAMRYAELEIKLFVLYSLVIFAASLHSPLGLTRRPFWQELDLNVNMRYWWFPTLAFEWALIWCTLGGKSRYSRAAAFCILLLMQVGTVRDWKYDPYPDEHFSLYAHRFQQAKPGEHIIIPIIPAGKQMELIKKPS